MPRRLAPLRIAATLAVGFVVLRVAYRIVFGGAAGNGILVIELPRLRLVGPFSHIALFGDVTTGGIAAAAMSAVPFAVLILAFGLLAALVDVRALLTRGAVRGPVRTVSRALVVAWATFPALLASVRRVRAARELRGERSAASLIVPVLEQTVERAIALGASMEVRGFAASRRAELDRGHPARLRDAALGFEGRWIVQGIDLEIAPGSLTLVTGATGAGKSTLLHAMSGLLQHVFGGEQDGMVEVGGVPRAAVPPRETAGFVGVVAQSVRLSFVAGTVSDELGFALATRRADSAITAERVREVAGSLGIAHLLHRGVETLSAGEACLVAIGAAIIARPALLLVDEPLADLDDAARRRVIGVLDRVAHEAGAAVVVAEHAVSHWHARADLRIELRAGRVRPGRAADERSREDRVRRPVSGRIALVQHIVVRHGDFVAVDDVGFTLAAGDLVALHGPNGAGKSSLLHAVARPQRRGTVLVDGADVAQQRRRARRHLVSLVPEAFDDLLFTTTVAAECRRSGPGTAETFARFLGFSSAADAKAILERHPRDLSAGERLCLVIAIQLSARPRVLLVDEPTRGLDSDARRLVGDALSAAADSGAAVLVATHDDDFAGRIASRTLRMAEGRILSAVPVSAGEP